MSTLLLELFWLHSANHRALRTQRLHLSKDPVLHPKRVPHDHHFITQWKGIGGRRDLIKNKTKQNPRSLQILRLCPLPWLSNERLLPNTSVCQVGPVSLNLSFFL